VEERKLLASKILTFQKTPLKSSNSPSPEDVSRALRRASVESLISSPVNAFRLWVAVKREMCRRSLLEFIKTFWREVSNDDFCFNWHIEFLCQELEQLASRVGNKVPKTHDLIINIPPGTTKTTICSIMFPVWCWINWHWIRFITASYSGALSLESAEYSRDLVRSDLFRALFPDLTIKQDKDTKSNFKIQKRMPNGSIAFGGNRYSTSVGGTLTGFHGHILIVDDPLDPNRAVSETEIRNANHWMEMTLSTRKVDKERSPIVLIMQRLHEDDPAGHILSKRKSTVKHICLPGEIRHFKDQLKPSHLAARYMDDLLDPVRMSWKVLEEMEVDLGQYGYSAQVGQTPVPPGGGMFKVDHFSVIDHFLESEVADIVRYWDKAGTAGGGAYTVGCKMARLKSGKFLVLDVKRGQWSSEVREAIIRETAEADGPSVVIYLEQEPGSGGKDSVDWSIRNLAGFRVFADHPTGNKVYRADPLSVQVNRGNVLLLRGEWNRAFIEEFRNFPFGTYKDQVDAASAAFNRLALAKFPGIYLIKSDESAKSLQSEHILRGRTVRDSFFAGD